jgi:hypothetical protein
MESNEFKGRVAFAIGTGRCGTHFIDRVMKMEPDIASWHERHPMSDAFHRYCQWYDLQIDNAGFIENKRSGICKDLAAHGFSFEASAYLSLSVRQLYETFDAKFVLLVRRPDKMVNSYIQKGFYKIPLVRFDYDLPAGYQPGAIAVHHPFSRIAPTGDEAAKWQEYSQVGKLSWFWKTINWRVLDIFQEIPKTHWRIVRLEGFSHKKYLSVAEFIGFSSFVSEAQYNKLVNKRPGTLNPARTVYDWDARERTEFESEVGELADELGYEWRVRELFKVTERVPSRQKTSMYRRVRCKAAQMKRTIFRSVQGLK